MDLHIYTLLTVLSYVQVLYRFHSRSYPIIDQTRVIELETLFFKRRPLYGLWGSFPTAGLAVNPKDRLATLPLKTCTR